MMAPSQRTGQTEHITNTQECKGGVGIIFRGVHGFAGGAIFILFFQTERDVPWSGVATEKRPHPLDELDLLTRS